MTGIQDMFLALNVVVITGEVTLAAMIWHLAKVVQLHDRRADLEWRSIQAKLTEKRDGQ